MKWLTFRVQREPGFRFNLTDFVLIAVLIGLSAYSFQIYPYHHFYLLPVYIGGSFFLFCNVFRIGNRLESYWYVTFLMLTLALIRAPAIYWPVMLAVCEPLKVFLIVVRIRQPEYVGVFSRAAAKTVVDPD